MNKFFARVYQKALFVASVFVPFPQPYIYESDKSSSLNDFVMDIKNKGFQNVLFITGKTVCKLDLFLNILDLLKQNNINYCLFNDISPDPDIKEIEEGVKFYKDNNCDLIISVGGGSSIDAGKIIAARITNDKPIYKMKGLLKIHKKPVPFYVIPTTAGTGSECTVAAVVSDKDNNKKFAISSPKLIPNCCVFIPEFLMQLPPKLIASTGMDALTHAVEAFIGKSNTAQTKNDALVAISFIYNCLYRAYSDPSDYIAQYTMQYASYYAGRAFTKAYVGNVHALAHSFGAFCHVSHGYANAVLLPKVLRYYGKSIDKKLRIIEKEIGLKGNFIDWIEELNKKMSIPDKFDLDITDKIDSMIEHSYNEAVPLYPCPVIFDKEDFRKLFKEVTK